MQSECIADATFPVGRNIALLNGFSAARSALFLLPVLVPYFGDHVGLSFRETLLTEAAFAATMVLTEMPSGWLADHWRRKNVLVLGAALWAAGCLCLWAAGGFAAVVVGQVLMGLAASLQSGADSALLYDSLLCTGAQSRYLPSESRRHSIAMVSLATASALAGPLYAWDVDAIFALSTMAYLLSGICALALVEPPRHRVYRGRFDLSAMIQVVLQECRYNRVVLWVVLFAGDLMAATKASVWTQQAYLLLLDVDLFWFGPITAAALLVGGLVSLFGPSIDRSIGASAALGIVVAGVVAGFVLGGSLPSTWMVPILFVAFAAYGIAHPALKALVNDRGSSDRRATILSVLSLVPQLTFVGLSPFVGRIVDDRGADSGYLFLAGFAAISAGAAWYGLAR